MHTTNPARRTLVAGSLLLFMPLLLLALLGSNTAVSILTAPRLDLVPPESEVVVVQVRGLSRQELSFRSPAPGGAYALHRHLVLQGWRYDRHDSADPGQVYHRRILGGLVMETVRFEFERPAARIGIVRCVRWIGCG